MFQNVQGGCMFQMMEYKCTRWLYVSDGSINVQGGCMFHVSDDGV